MPTLLAILMQPSARGLPDAGSASVGLTSLSRPATTQVFNHLMQQLPALVSAMHAHLQPWVPQLLELVRMHWHSPLLLQVIALLEQLTMLLRQALSPYTAELIPLLAAVIEADNTAQRVLSLRALKALDGFGPLLQEYTSLLLPAILRLLSQADPGSRAQEEALLAAQRISAHLPLARAATSFVPVLLRILKEQAETKEQELRPQVVTLLTTFMALSGRAWRSLMRETFVAFGEAGLPNGRPLSKMGVSKSRQLQPAANGCGPLLNQKVAEYHRLLPAVLDGNHAELLAFYTLKACATGARRSRRGNSRYGCPCSRRRCESCGRAAGCSSIARFKTTGSNGCAISRSSSCASRLTRATRMRSGRTDARAVGASTLQRWLHGLLGRARGRIVREPVAAIEAALLRRPPLPRSYRSSSRWRNTWSGTISSSL